MPELVHATSVKHVVVEITTVDNFGFTIDVYSTGLRGVLAKIVGCKFCAVIPAATSQNTDTAGESKV